MHDKRERARQQRECAFGRTLLFAWKGDKKKVSEELEVR